MLVNGKHYRTVWMERETVKLIDQTKLPFSFEICDCENYRETIAAIKNMIIRGAPAIGATAAYAFAQAILGFKGNNFKSLKIYLEAIAKEICTARPTAYDSFYAIKFVKNAVLKAKSVKQAKKIAMKVSKQYADLNVKKCEQIGKNGEELIKNNAKILTHCNAGWLACVDYGTALAPIYLAKRKGKKVFIYVSETRPWLQGMLTAWELQQEGVDHAVIADNAAGYFMQNKEIDLVIVGADRIALNGDVVNKIGTYEKAVLAKENGIPFYVAAPSSTFDLSCKSGKDIIIEERDEKEVLYINKVRIAPKGSAAKNPAFDLTSAKYITGIITEKGIIKAKDIRELFSK